MALYKYLIWAHNKGPNECSFKKLIKIYFNNRPIMWVFNKYSFKKLNMGL